MKDEIAEWPLERDRGAPGGITEVVQHEAVLHTIQAESKSAVFGGWRSDRISARNLFAVRCCGFYGEPLSWNISETGEVTDFEFQVPGIAGKKNGIAKTC